MTNAAVKKSWAKEVSVTVTGSVIILVIQNFLALKGTAPHAPAAGAVSPAAKATALRHFERGKECARVGQPSQAVEQYTEALRLDPTFVDGYFLRGWAHLCLGQTEQAIQDYTETLRLDPTSSRAFANRGWAYGQLGRFDEAIQDCNEALRLDPSLAQARRNREWAVGRRDALRLGRK